MTKAVIFAEASEMTVFVISSRLRRDLGSV
jgi:hypothetical protein